MFVNEELCLCGTWSFTTTNGGFDVFKSSTATLCFYRGTKTVTVQGAKQDFIRKNLLKIVKSQDESKHVVNKNGNWINHQQEPEAHEEDSNDRMSSIDTNFPSQNMECSGWCKNLKDISDLGNRDTRRKTKSSDKDYCPANNFEEAHNQIHMSGYFERNLMRN